MCFMIWRYEKDAQTVGLETRYDNRTLQYVLITHRPEGDEIERYERIEDFSDRLLTLERALADGDWHRSGPPILSPARWSDPLTK
jgi:hypothetical protein